MSSTTTVAFSEDLLRGACLSHGLSGDGTAAELHARLGDFFVRRLLASETCAPDVVTDKKKGKKRAAPTATAAGEQPRKRAATAWHAFLKTEKEKVRSAGITGRVDIIKECARRYALHKKVLCNEAPLMIMDAASAGSSTDAALSDTDSSIPEEDGLLEALRAELDETAVNAALAAYGLPIDGDTEAKFKSLAQAMLM